MHIVQIAPEIAPGSGVAGVAHELERQFRAAGAQVERFTLADSGRRAPHGSAGRLMRAVNVVWFSTIGTVRARRFLAARPDAVSICHNDAMTGDIYVNHGLLRASLRARGHYFWRMVRNPLHLFTTLRDQIRYRGTTHRAVVALTTVEKRLLEREYPRLRAEVSVIGNGVDIDRFRPPSADERRTARASLGYADDEFVALFIGHEFERKGLSHLIDALSLTAAEVVLLVVGGTRGMIADARATAEQSGCSERVRFVGVRADVVPFLWAADALALPSAYESSGLVFLEALAAGVPVVAPPVGVVPDVIDGHNGFVAERDAAAIALRLGDLRRGDRAAQSRAARDSALPYAWAGIASHYLELAEHVVIERD